jgi:hypothetical protein
MGFTLEFHPRRRNVQGCDSSNRGDASKSGSEANLNNLSSVWAFTLNS